MTSLQGPELLEQRLRYHAIQCLVLSGTSLLLAAGLFAGAVVQVMEGVYQQGAFLAGGGLLFSWLTWAQVQGWRTNRVPRAGWVYKELTGDAKGVAWFHRVVGSNNGVRIYFLDDQHITIPANHQDSEALMAWIRWRAPHAILGYGAEQQRCYEELVKKNRAAGQVRT
jgi:hypothetical protein